jgi:hypothetical protein
VKKWLTLLQRRAENEPVALMAARTRPVLLTLHAATVPVLLLYLEKGAHTNSCTRAIKGNLALMQRCGFEAAFLKTLGSPSNNVIGGWRSDSR